MRDRDFAPAMAGALFIIAGAITWRNPICTRGSGLGPTSAVSTAVSGLFLALDLPFAAPLRGEGDLAAGFFPAAPAADVRFRLVPDAALAPDLVLVRDVERPTVAPPDAACSEPWSSASSRSVVTRSLPCN